MAVKYRLDYTSVNNVDYRCDISTPSYSGSIIELEGNVIYGLNSVDSLSHPIRSKYLDLEIRADLTQPLTDLFTQGERYWRVELYRDGNKIFFGYLTSEQAPQSFVEDTWILSLKALDPLAFLEDLAYVDASGTEYNGYERVGRVIANCLKRGFQSATERFNILAYVPYDFRMQTDFTVYDEQTGGVFMTTAQIWQDNFIDENSDEVLSCQEVLEKVLKSLQLTITQINGDTWLVSHYLYDVSGIESKYIEHYDSDWIVSAGAYTSPWGNVEIKTDSQTTLPTDVIHCNENQQYHYNYPLAKKTIDSKYDYRDSILPNPDLDGGTAGVSMPGWDVNLSNANPESTGYVKIYRETTSATTYNLGMKSLGDVYVNQGMDLALNVTAEANYDPGGDFFPILFFQVRLESFGDVYYLYYTYNDEQPLSWKYSASGTPDVKIRMDFEDNNKNPITGSDVIFKIKLPTTPLSPSRPTKVSVEFYEAGGQWESPRDTAKFIAVKSVDIVPTSIVSGRTGVATRNDGGYKSEKDEIYFDASANTVTGSGFVFTNNYPITQVKDRAYDVNEWQTFAYIKAHNDIIDKKLKLFFTGDFWNFFEPHKLVKIPDLNINNYRVLDYSFDTAENTGSVRLEENNTATIPASVSTKNIYAQTVKPTIK